MFFQDLIEITLTETEHRHSHSLVLSSELMWALDDSITYGAKMLKLINSLEVKNDEQPDEE